MICLGMHNNVMLRFIVQAFPDPPLCSSTSYTCTVVWCHMTACLLPYPKHRCFRPLVSIMPHCLLFPWPCMATWFSDMTACPYVT